MFCGPPNSSRTFYEAHQRMSQNQITLYACLCLKMGIAHSASSILPRGSAGHIPPDPTRSHGQAVTVALVGSPGPDKIILIKLPCPLSDPKKTESPSLRHLSRLDSTRLAPGPGRGRGVILQGLCNYNATIRRFGDITHQPAPYRKTSPGVPSAPVRASGFMIQTSEESL